MEKRDNGIRRGALTAVVAALGDQKEILESRNQERTPRLELEEIKAELDREISNEIAYLRETGIISTKVQEETVEIELNPEADQKASEMKEMMYNHFGGSLKALATSDEYMDFEPPNGWPLWEGPETNDLAKGSIDYGQNLGPLCAIMSMYGEERLQGADITEYSLEALEDGFSLESYEPELDLKPHLDTLERLGYLERHSTDLIDVYRLADDEEAKMDAEMIAQHRNEVFSGYPQNMAFAYDEADRVELENEGVKLVQRPEKQIQ